MWTLCIISIKKEEHFANFDWFVTRFVILISYLFCAHTGCQMIPMCQRNFPPSFWNANLCSGSTNNTNTCSYPTNIIYHTNTGTGPLPHRDASTSSYLPAAASTDAYAMRATAAVHHTQPDAWHYGYPHQSAAYAHHHHAGFHDLGYGMPSAGSAFSPRYSSLLIQPSVRPGRLPTIPGQCEFSKPTTEWPSTYTPHSHQSTDLSCYSTEPGRSLMIIRPPHFCKCN